jgi:hypothetical protein
VGRSGLEGSRLPPSKLLVLEERPDGFFLTRYSARGDFAGDTWHRDYEDAMSQANFEFSESTQNWVAIPAEETDAIDFVRRLSI